MASTTETDPEQSHAAVLFLGNTWAHSLGPELDCVYYSILLGELDFVGLCIQTSINHVVCKKGSRLSSSLTSYAWLVAIV